MECIVKRCRRQLFAGPFEGAEEFGFGGVPHDYATTLNKDHGRIERRECWTISDPSCLEYLSAGQDWPGLRSVVKVVGRRETPAGTTVQPRYYISSLDMYRLAILTISTSGARGEREDFGGQAIREKLPPPDYEEVQYEVVSDDDEVIEK